MSHSRLRSPAWSGPSPNPSEGTFLLQGWPGHLDPPRRERLRYIKSEDKSEPRKQWRDQKRGEVWGGRKKHLELGGDRVGVGKEAAETGAPFLASLSYLESRDFCHFRLILDSAGTESAVFCPSPVHGHGCFHFSKKHLSPHYFWSFCFWTIENNIFSVFPTKKHITHTSITLMSPVSTGITSISVLFPRGITPGDMGVTAGMFKLVCVGSNYSFSMLCNLRKVMWPLSASASPSVKYRLIIGVLYHEDSEIKKHVAQG